MRTRRRRRTKREIIQDDLQKDERQRTMAEFARKKTPPIKLIESKPKEPEPIVLKEIKPEMKIILTEDKSKKQKSSNLKKMLNNLVLIFERSYGICVIIFPHLGQ